MTATFTTPMRRRAPASCNEAFASVERLRDELAKAGLAVPSIVAGGTPTFPIHAGRAGVECSPGTSVFWDWNYSTNLPDLDFLPAVLVLTRIVSKPGDNRLCLDLGHKAIASENPPPRVLLMGLPETTAVGHSEEHLVVETGRAGEFPVALASVRVAVAHLPHGRAPQRGGRHHERPGERPMAGRGSRPNDHNLSWGSGLGTDGSCVGTRPDPDARSGTGPCEKWQVQDLTPGPQTFIALSAATLAFVSSMFCSTK